MNTICRVIVSLFMLGVININLSSQSKYFTYLNEFGMLNNANTHIVGKILYDNNTKTDCRFNAVPFDCVQSVFSCHIRIANKNNNEGKTYKVKDDNGKTHKISNPEWGFVWNYVDDNNYYEVRLKGNNTALYDLMDKRELKIEVNKITHGNKETLKTASFTENVDLYDGYNVILMKYDGSKTLLFVGNKELQPLCQLNNVVYGDSIKLGYFADAGSEIGLERLVFKKSVLPGCRLSTNWNKTSLDEYLKSTTDDSLEGVWQYLDRDIDEEKFKLGGKYSIALVKNQENGYDILYYAGAVVNSQKWDCGMLKGRLTATQFQNNYNLVWYDATMREMNDDTYATIDNGNILTLFFPVEKAQLRFVKQ